MRSAPKLLLVQFPSHVKNFSKTKEVEMDRSYNHIKHLVDSNEVFKSKKRRPGCHELTLPYDPKQHANQMGDKQGHTGFDY